jgi:hypothetical protein
VHVRAGIYEPLGRDTGEGWAVAAACNCCFLVENAHFTGMSFSHQNLPSASYINKYRWQLASPVSAILKSTKRQEALKPVWWSVYENTSENWFYLRILCFAKHEPELLCGTNETS